MKKRYTHFLPVVYIIALEFQQIPGNVMQTPLKAVKKPSPVYQRVFRTYRLYSQGL